LSAAAGPERGGAAAGGRGGAAAGIGMMLLGILMFAVNDTLGKWLVGGYSVGQLLLVRTAAGLLVMAPLILRTGRGRFRHPPRPRLQLLRVGLSTAESGLFYWALAGLPLAEGMTYYMAGPVYVAALSPLLLGERVGARRWLAVAAGFAGVLLALRSSPERLTLPALCAVGGSLTYALFLVATRRLAGTPGTVLMTAQLAGAGLFGGALVLWQGWTPPGWRDGALMLVLGAGSLAGNLCVNRSLRLAPASAVVPFQYTLIVWGVVFGWLVFGDMPDRLTLLGAAVIVGAGLALLRAERST